MVSEETNENISHLHNERRLFYNWLSTRKPIKQYMAFYFKIREKDLHVMFIKQCHMDKFWPRIFSFSTSAFYEQANIHFQNTFFRKMAKDSTENMKHCSFGEIHLFRKHFRNFSKNHRNKIPPMLCQVKTHTLNCQNSHLCFSECVQVSKIKPKHTTFKKK